MKRGKYSREIGWIRSGITKLGGYSNKPHFSRVSIRQLEFKPTVVSWVEDGITKKAKYADLKKVAKDPTELRLRLQMALAEKQELEAVYQLKTKGQVSRQFKKSLEGNYSLLKSYIGEFEKEYKLSPEQLKTVLADYEIDETGVLEEPLLEDSEDKYQFYHRFGFTDLNTFTINLYKALGGADHEGSEFQ